MTGPSLLDTRVEFVGRTAELAQLRSIIDRDGIVTLTGPGGVGKSRLAYEAALRAYRDSARETVFIGLAGSGGEDVLGAVAVALGVQEELGRDAERILRGALEGRGVLLIVDNCEHVPDESSRLMELLGSVEGVAAVATSQRRLDYPNERVIEVHPFDAKTGTEFFLARARVSRVEIGDADRSIVSRIVDRLDGLAIAIDLAAARLGSLGVEALSRELQHLRPYSFRSTAAAEKRHWTIGRVVEWTCALLEPDAQSAFVLCAMFVDPFTFEDLAGVAGSDPQVLRNAFNALCAHSLIFETDGRCTMLAPIRAVAARMLALRHDRRSCEERFAARMDAVAAELQGQSTVAISERYGDFSTALGWAMKRPAERLSRVLQVAAALARVWADGGRFDDGLRWVERLLDAVGTLPPAVRGDVYYIAIRVWHAVSRFEQMLSVGTAAISSYSICANALGLARSYNALAVASLYTNRIEEAEKYVETAVTMYERVGSKRGIGSALANHGNVLLEGRNDPRAAHARYEEALAILQQDGSDTLIGIVCGNMAESAHFLGDFEASLDYVADATAHFSRTQSAAMLGWMRQCAGRTHLALGETEASRRELNASFDLLERSPQPLYIALACESSAALLLQEGDRRRAAALFAAAAHTRRTRRLPLTGPWGLQTAERQRALNATLSVAERSALEAEAAATETAHLPAKARKLLGVHGRTGPASTAAALTAQM